MRNFLGHLLYIQLVPLILTLFLEDQFKRKSEDKIREDCNLNENN